MEQETKRRRLHGKQKPIGAYVKMLMTGPADEEWNVLDENSGGEEEEEVTRTITLKEVYENLQEWIQPLKSELDAQYTKGCLKRVKMSEIKEIEEKGNIVVKILPSKLVAVKKKKPMKKLRRLRKFRRRKSQSRKPKGEDFMESKDQ